MSRWLVAITVLLSVLAFSPTKAFGRPRDTTQIVAGGSKITFPDSWLSQEIRGRAIPLDSSEVARSRRVVSSALALYPPSVLDQNLSVVYVVKEMSFYGVRYGGTNSRSAVYISNRGIREGFSDLYLSSTFHHEFSSILLRNYAYLFDEVAWRAANLPGEHYKKTGTQSLLDGTAETRFSSNYHVSGFLNQYGTSSVEEDFNTFAEALFSGDIRFWKAVESFPRVALKKELIVSFYHSIDPRFDESYFRALVTE